MAAANGEDEEDELNRQKRLEGTAVTPESFVAWRVRHDVVCLRHVCMGVWLVVYQIQRDPRPFPVP